MLVIGTAPTEGTPFPRRLWPELIGVTVGGKGVAAPLAEEPDGNISVEYAACLECGTCLTVAAPGALKWHYPRGGFGVQFREG